MSSILTTARLVFKDTQARQKAIEAFHQIITYTTSHEPEVLQYVCALPLDDSAGNEIYMVEEYANQAASDTHLTTKPVQDLISLFSTGDVLAQPPDVQNGSVLAKKIPGSPPLVPSKPAIVLLNFVPGSGAATKFSEDWEEYAESAVIGMEGISAFIVVEDQEKNSTRVECVLRDWDTFAELRKTLGTDETGSIEAVNIVPIDGFIGRDEKSRL